jgi:hypothetical protein
MGDTEAGSVVRTPGVAAEEAGHDIDSAKQHRDPAREPARFQRSD